MQSLAVKYRPKSFDQVCGQGSIISILNRQLETHNYSHAYIFSGLSGSGKTTVARIFANEINKGSGGLIEIDAASNNGVDNIREITKSASERSLSGEYKIFILDEAHMLTTQAWNALLKVIEETPEFTIFILCTTEYQKIPATIKNRCMHLPFKGIPVIDLAGRLMTIVETEYGVLDSMDLCNYIAKISNGSLRTAISNIEKVALFDSQLKLSSACELFAQTGFELLFELTNKLIDGDELAVLNILDTAKESCGLRVLLESFTDFILNVNKYVICKNCSIPVSYNGDLDSIISIGNASQYYFYIMNKLIKLQSDIKGIMNPESVIYVTFLNICRCL